MERLSNTESPTYLPCELVQKMRHTARVIALKSRSRIDSQRNSVYMPRRRFRDHSDFVGQRSNRRFDTFRQVDDATGGFEPFRHAQ